MKAYRNAKNCRIENISQMANSFKNVNSPPDVKIVLKLFDAPLHVRVNYLIRVCKRILIDGR